MIQYTYKRFKDKERVPKINPQNDMMTMSCWAAYRHIACGFDEEFKGNVVLCHNVGFGNPIYSCTNGPKKENVEWFRDEFLPLLFKDSQFNFVQEGEYHTFTCHGKREAVRLLVHLHTQRIATEWPEVVSLLRKLFEKGVPVLDCLALSKGLLPTRDLNGRWACILLEGLQVTHMVGSYFDPVRHRKALEELYHGPDFTVDSPDRMTTEYHAKITNGISTDGIFMASKPSGRGGDNTYRNTFTMQYLNRSVVAATEEELVESLYTFWKQHMEESK